MKTLKTISELVAAGVVIIAGFLIAIALIFVFCALAIHTADHFERWLKVVWP